LTVVVPAPDEPVTATTGCFFDMIFSLDYSYAVASASL